MTRNALPILALLVTAAGCATRAEVLEAGIRENFSSSMVPMKLAVCIDRNAEAYAWGSLRSKIVDPSADPLEVMIFNGSGTYAVVHITKTAHGSAAVFSMGGAATISSTNTLRVLTENCGPVPAGT